MFFGSGERATILVKVTLCLGSSNALGNVRKILTQRGTAQVMLLTLSFVLFFHRDDAYRLQQQSGHWQRRRSSALSVVSRDSVPAPSVPVAINGGDPWVGWKVTDAELDELCEAATSSVGLKPVMKQFHPRRGWLWRQWHGTIVRSVLQNEVKLNLVWAFTAVTIVQLTGLNVFKPMENFFPIGQTLVAFVLSFFLSQTYAVWRNVYSITRRIQGRISDMGMLLATCAERDSNGVHSPRSQAMLDTWARYARLFTYLFFASVTTRFAPLATPKGLRALQKQGAITADEAVALMETSSWHQTVISWMGTLMWQASEKGSLGGGSSAAFQASRTLAELRACYGQMSDELSGRMPLAYTHLVQLFVDLLCLAAPLALVGPLGPVGAVGGTCFVTLFYAGILSLAKMFLDPFDNEDYGGRSGIRLEADTLVQEINALTKRWTTCSITLPPGVLSPTLSSRSFAKFLPPLHVEGDPQQQNSARHASETTSTFMDDDFYDSEEDEDGEVEPGVLKTKVLEKRDVDNFPADSVSLVEAVPSSSGQKSSNNRKSS